MANKKVKLQITGWASSYGGGTGDYALLLAELKVLELRYGLGVEELPITDADL